jgi:hypothetical protein
MYHMHCGIASISPCIPEDAVPPGCMVRLPDVFAAGRGLKTFLCGRTCAVPLNSNKSGHVLHEPVTHQ